jgi:hypothetical protein
MIELNLQKLTINQAVSSAETFLLGEIKNNSNFKLKIITEKSPESQIRIIQEVLDKNELEWESRNNGELIVKYTRL